MKTDATGDSRIVRECLERIVDSAAFRASHRPKQFLSFVVERTLEGRQDEIKERTIGTEVFGRTADFETSGDSIVRVNANEVRRRLAQYYHDAPTQDPVQIILPPGTYIPEFTFRDAPSAAPSPARAAPELPQGQVGEARPRWLWWGAGAIITVSVSAVLPFFFLHSRSDALDRFWAPVLSVSSAPVICLPTRDTHRFMPDALREFDQLKPGGSMQLKFDQVERYHNWHVSMPVLQAAIAVYSTLQRNGRAPLLRIGTDLKQDELRGHPVIAIGSFSNPWVQQSVAGLRFTFDRGASDQESPRIRDARDPRRSWSLSSVFPRAQTMDYAIVTRTFDRTTGEPFVSLAGLHSFGCQIAGEFLSQPSFWKELSATAPNGWERMNLQVVLETMIIGITPSPPKVVDTYFWK